MLVPMQVVLVVDMLAVFEFLLYASLVLRRLQVSHACPLRLSPRRPTVEHATMQVASAAMYAAHQQ